MRQFYILLKIHKDYIKSLPIGYPGRPNVSACNSYTENISKYFNFILLPYMKLLPSNVKDTSDFLRKLKSLPKLSKDSVQLYTNIPHEDGITACKYFLMMKNVVVNYQRRKYALFLN
jgi:hypothetical protein